MHIDRSIYYNTKGDVLSTTLSGKGGGGGGGGAYTSSHIILKGDTVSYRVHCSGWF